MEEKRDGGGRYIVLSRGAALVTRPSTVVASIAGLSRVVPRVERPGKSVLFPAIASRRCVAPLEGNKRKKGEKRETWWRAKDAGGVISIARKSRAL